MSLGPRSSTSDVLGTGASAAAPLSLCQLPVSKGLVSRVSLCQMFLHTQEGQDGLEQAGLRWEELGREVDG